VLELVLGLEVLESVLGLDLGKLLNICAHTKDVPMLCIVHLMDQKCVYTMTVCDPSAYCSQLAAAGKLLSTFFDRNDVPMFCIVHLLDQKCVYTMTVCDP